MSTLLDIKKAAAGILGVSTSEFTVGGVDLWLLAANQVRKTAELEHDFEFNRKTVSVTVDGTTGGDLGDVVDENDNSVEVKTVLDVGILDDQGNLIPAVWTTVAESLERQRGDNRRSLPLYRRDFDQDAPLGLSRFTFSGDKIYRWPKTTESEVVDFSLVIEAYTFTSDWTSSSFGAGTGSITGTSSPDLNSTLTAIGSYNGRVVFISNNAATDSALIYFDGAKWLLVPADQGVIAIGSDYFSLASTADAPDGSYTEHGAYTGTPVIETDVVTSNIWTTHGQQFLLWSTIVHLNKLFKVFVPRQEGNLPPPTDLAQEGLQTLVDWDTNKYEQFRRHNR